MGRRTTSSSYGDQEVVLHYPCFLSPRFVVRSMFVFGFNTILDPLRFKELLDGTQAAISDIEGQLQLRQLANSPHRVDRSRPSNHQLRTRLERYKNDEKCIVQTMARAKEQSMIIQEKSDLQSLVRALRAFTTLQQIRLMRVQDRVDIDWAIFLRSRNDPALSDFKPLEWTLAFEHAAKTLGFV